MHRTTISQEEKMAKKRYDCNKHVEKNSKYMYRDVKLTCVDGKFVVMRTKKPQNKTKTNKCTAMSKLVRVDGNFVVVRAKQPKTKQNKHKL